MKDTEQSFARDAYCGIELDLPNGSTLTCNPLPLRRAIEFLDLLDKARRDEFEATKKILETFPAAIGVVDSVFDDMTPGEVFDVIYRFFAFRRQTTPAPTANGVAPPNNGRQPSMT